ncbi:MAG: hypothetical protein AAF986_03975 [Pseudomonadota bacterium]
MFRSALLLSLPLIIVGAGYIAPVPGIVISQPQNNMSINDKNEMSNETSLAPLFDVSVLPSPPAAPPPPPPVADPALALASTQLVGTIAADGEFTLLASEPGGFYRLKIGDPYKGFTLTGLSTESATFSNGETDVVRPVNRDQREAVQ